MIAFKDLTSGAAFVSALGCGLMAGVFFCFSTFVMKALARLPSEQGIAGMQSINVAAVNSWFLGAFLGTTGFCVLVAILALRRWGERSASSYLAGAAIYLLGCFLVTVVCNVPLNDSLASLAADDPDRVTKWTRYVAVWTAWNHVRTLSSLIAAGLLTSGLD